MRLIEQLITLFETKDQVSTNETVLMNHGKSMTYHRAHIPDAVVFPKTEEELVRLTNFAVENEIPLVPFGVGSSLEGQTIPNYGGIVVNFSEMNQIVNIDPENFSATVQPGVTREQLNIALKQYGLFFPVDPGANATIGGMTATNASGTNAIKYGTMRQQVKKLSVVLPSGELITVGTEAVKSSAGYALKELFVGSEGTLGFITKITVKLYGIEEENAAIKVSFEDLAKTSEAAFALLSSGLSLTKIELVDAETVAVVNAYSNTNFVEKPSLFIEISGSKGEVLLKVKMVEEVLASFEKVKFEIETNSIAKAKLWEARHHAGLAIAVANKGKALMTTDVCVPLSKLTDAIQYSRQVVDEYGIKASILGHIGDGNFHVVLAVNPEDEDELSVVKMINEKIVLFALAVGGTCTGEHGIGTGKIDYLQQEHASSYHIMKLIKNTIDPKNVFSPGVLFKTKSKGAVTYETN